MPIVLRDDPRFLVVEYWPHQDRARHWRAALVRGLSESMIGWYATSSEASAAAREFWPGLPVQETP